MDRSLPSRVRPQDGCRHLDADAALRTRRPLGRLLRHRAVGRPVHVEVVGEHELRARLRHAVEDGLRQRREQLDPLRVVGLGAVIDDSRTGARPPGLVRRGDVGPDLLDACRHVRSARPRHGPHRQPPGHQLADDGRARPAPGAQDHMRRSGRHLRSLFTRDGAAVRPSATAIVPARPGASRVAPVGGPAAERARSDEHRLGRRRTGRGGRVAGAVEQPADGPHQWPHDAAPAAERRRGRPRPAGAARARTPASTPAPRPAPTRRAAAPAPRRARPAGAASAAPG